MYSATDILFRLWYLAWVKLQFLSKLQHFSESCHFLFFLFLNIKKNALKHVLFIVIKHNQVHKRYIISYRFRNDFFLTSFFLGGGGGVGGRGEGKGGGPLECMSPFIWNFLGVLAESILPCWQNLPLGGIISLV